MLRSCLSEGKYPKSFNQYRTSIYIMGLMCNSQEGRREVTKYNWMSSLSQGVSVCLPRDPMKLFRVSDYTF
jgi:hypothetical protein